MNFTLVLLRNGYFGQMREIRRQLSMVKNKYSLSVKQSAANQFEEGIKYRRHPGIRSHKGCAELPYKLQLAALSVINKYKGKRFRQEVEKVKAEFLEVMVEQKEENMNKNSNVKKIEFDHDVQKQKFEDKFDRESSARMQDERKSSLIREPYSSYECAAYMTARLPANYSALMSIFQEIHQEEPQFRPSTLFDFGSGVGTTIWASDEMWKGAIKEIFAVDLNENMNELSRELLQNGTGYCDNILDRIFYRQFLPAKHIPMYDLVVSSFSLLEFHDTRSRMYMVENLWKKTSGMLVFVEHGSKAGFAAVMEARNFVLQVSNKQLDPLTANDSVNSGNVSRHLKKSEGSVVAPCPHDLICPRHSVLLQKSFCNFTSNYQVFDYGQPKPTLKSEKFAYVVLKKHGVNQWSEEQKIWPRIVQPVVKKSHHTICRICTSRGELNEIILSKSKIDRHMYKSARASKWGDKLPADIVEMEPKDSQK